MRLLQPPKKQPKSQTIIEIAGALASAFTAPASIDDCSTGEIEVRVERIAVVARQCERRDSSLLAE